MEPAGLRPATVTNNWINLLGLLGAAGVVWLLIRDGQPAAHAAGLGIVSLALLIGLLEIGFLKTHARPSSGLGWGGGRTVDPGRIAVKLLGLVATLGLIGLAYWLAPEYRAERYAAFWYVLLLTWPYIAFVMVVYFVAIDKRMHQPRDGYFQMGCVVLGRFGQVDRRTLAQHLLGWAIKGFFVPLMFVYLVDELDRFDSLARSSELSFLGWFDLLFSSAFVIDLLFTAAGYLFCVRLFDSHIRSADATASGWLVALICYEPFWLFFYWHYWPYRADTAWTTWLADSPLLYVWGGLILALMAVYAWTTLTFGLRFSNLTHRGILTSGPYRYTKHPGYLTKNLVWWLMAMPFLSTAGWPEALRHSLMLLAVNGLYFLRARTEERHLSYDPTYVAYATWMNDHGWLRWFGRRIPSLHYTPPAGQ